MRWRGLEEMDHLLGQPPPSAPSQAKRKPKAPTQAVRLEALEARLATAELELSNARRIASRSHTLSVIALAVVAALALIPRLLTLVMVIGALVAAGAVVVRVVVAKEPAITATVKVLAGGWRMVMAAASASAAGKATATQQ